LGGLGSKGAIFFHCASVSNGPDRAIDPPLALLTLLIPHFKKLNHSHFNALSKVVQQLLAILLMLWGAVTAVLIILVIYGNTLDSHEDEEIYINKKEEELMGGEQKVLVAKMERLKKLIFSLAIVSGILLLTSATIWVYIGLARG